MNLMNRPGASLLDGVVALISNTRLDVRLEGWPAAAAVASLCGGIVGLVSVLTGGRRDEAN